MQLTSTALKPSATPACPTALTAATTRAAGVRHSAVGRPAHRRASAVLSRTDLPALHPLAPRRGRPASPHGRSMRCKPGQPALDVRRPSTLPCWQLAALMCCMPGLPAHSGRRPASQHGRWVRCRPGQPTLDVRRPSTLPCWQNAALMCCMPGLPVHKGWGPASQHGRTTSCQARASGWALWLSESRPSVVTALSNSTSAATFRPPTWGFRSPSGPFRPASGQMPARSTGSVLFLPQWLGATVGQPASAVQLARPTGP